MAEDNPTSGYTRIQGALQNVGHRVGRSTIARILKAHGLPPVPQRPTSWQTFLRAHWGAIAGADFFTTEVWTWRGLVTYYTVFVIDLASRRVVLAGSTPWPNEMFMRQVVRSLTTEAGFLIAHRVVIYDRDGKWSREVRDRLGGAGMHVVQTPARAPNANAYAERFVRSIRGGAFRSDCPDRRTSFPPCARGVRRSLPRRAQSPRAGQRLDSRPTDDGHARPDSATAATGWTTQLLRASRMSASHNSMRRFDRVVGHYGSERAAPHGARDTVRCAVRGIAPRSRRTSAPLG
jgi:hypothetical protein